MSHFQRQRRLGPPSRARRVGRAGKLGNGESKLIRPLDGRLLLFRRVLALEQKPPGFGGGVWVIETSGMPR